MRFSAESMPPQFYPIKIPKALKIWRRRISGSPKSFWLSPEIPDCPRSVVAGLFFKHFFTSLARVLKVLKCLGGGCSFVFSFEFGQFPLLKQKFSVEESHTTGGLTADGPPDGAQYQREKALKDFRAGRTRARGRPNT